MRAPFSTAETAMADTPASRPTSLSVAARPGFLFFDKPDMEHEMQGRRGFAKPDDSPNLRKAERTLPKTGPIVAS